ncbi:ABC transporter permease [Catellatospora coxensis]
MLRAMLRDLRAHLGRVAMTVAAIVLGVGFVVATWVVSDSAAATVSSGSYRTDLAAVVQARPKNPADAAMPAEVVGRLAALPGVTRAEGVREGYAALVGKDGKIGTTSWAETGAPTGTARSASRSPPGAARRGPGRSRWRSRPPRRPACRSATRPGCCSAGTGPTPPPSSASSPTGPPAGSSTRLWRTTKPPRPGCCAAPTPPRPPRPDSPGWNCPEATSRPSSRPPRPR